MQKDFFSDVVTYAELFVITRADDLVLTMYKYFPL